MFWITISSYGQLESLACSLLIVNTIFFYTVIAISIALNIMLYAAAIALLWFVVWIIRRVVTRTLTRRCSQPLTRRDEQLRTHLRNSTAQR
jgi:ABC-type transport system involved in cytochrome bd biosynthesis fused ATPase/permease subunit